MPSKIPNYKFPNFLLPLFSGSGPPSFCSRASVPGLQSQPITYTNLLRNTSNTHQEVLLCYQQQLNHHKQQAYLNLLTRLIIPRHHTTVHRIIKVFPTSNTKTRTQLFHPTFHTHNNTISNIIHTLHGLPIPSKASQYHQDPTQHLPRPNRFQHQSQAPLIHLRTTKALPIHPNYLTISQSNFTPHRKKLSHTLNLRSIRPLYTPHFPKTTQQVFLRQRTSTLLLFKVPQLRNTNHLPTPLPHHTTHVMWIKHNTTNHHKCFTAT